MNEHLPPLAARRRSLRTSLPALVLVATLALAACGPSGEARGGASPAAATAELSIVATTTILADVTGHVTGDAAEMTTLMEAGADPHNFEASAQQLAQMREADLIVANGANLEEQLQGPLADAEGAGVPVFHATDHIETLTLGGGHEDGEHAEEGEHGHEEASVDPHFWMDPTRMADVVRALGEQIGGLSDDADAIIGQAGDYAAQLEELDEDINETLAAVPDDARTLVTNHEAFNYFADHYGFAIVGTVIPSLSTGAEPSAQDLEGLAHTVEEQRVTAVFAENTAPEQLARTLAAEAGTDVAVVELYSDSLGEEGSDAATYVDMLTANAELVRRALGG